ncbi:MAG: hypothetical protein V8T00_01485, partial [Oscillospiraceae bacterium]
PPTGCKTRLRPRRIYSESSDGSDHCPVGLELKEEIAMKSGRRMAPLALGRHLLPMAAGAKYSVVRHDKETQALGICPQNPVATATITPGEMSELAVVAFEKATGNVIDELERTDDYDNEHPQGGEWNTIVELSHHMGRSSRTRPSRGRNFSRSSRTSAKPPPTPLWAPQGPGRRSIVLDRRMGARGCATGDLHRRRTTNPLRHLSSAPSGRKPQEGWSRSSGEKTRRSAEQRQHHDGQRRGQRADLRTATTSARPPRRWRPIR